MPTPQRLPIVNSDDAVWGNILRQFIGKEHFNDDTDNAINGNHKTVTIRPGTATPGTAPLKLLSGTLLTSPEAGAVEFNTDKLYMTQTTGPTRKVVAAYDDSSGATGDVYYRDSSANFVRLPIGATNNSVLNVSGGIPAWGAAVATAATVSTIAQRDANANITANNLLNGYATTVTAASTTTLTVADKYLQYFTGTTTQTVKMPVTSTLALGQQWQIINNSTGVDSAGVVTVQSSGSNSILALPAGSYATITCVSTSGTSASSWSYSKNTAHTTVGKTDPSTIQTPVYGDLWIDTN